MSGGDLDYFNRDGDPIDLAEYVRLVQDLTYRSVADDTVNGVRVSTIWLGFDHDAGMSPAPIIFETMIFGGGEQLDQRMWRYATQAGALAGHDQALALVRELLRSTSA